MNQPLHSELWKNIQSFAFDDPSSTFPFSKKLQLENNWSLNFTNQAMEEYRKFIFLCRISATGASPSDAVDKVWHLHLTYTQNYWISLCKNTLHKDIHHHPSKGGNSEDIKHIDWYNDSLKLYKEVFGFGAPLNIWPQQNSVQVNIETPIYDKSFFTKTILLFFCATLFYIIATSLFQTNGEIFLIYYAVLSIAGLLVSFILHKHKEERIERIVTENFPLSFNTFEATQFMYGVHKVYQTALIDLLKRGIIDTAGNDYKRNPYQKDNNQTELNPLLETLVEKIKVTGIFTYPEGLIFMDKDLVISPVFDNLNRLAKKVDYQKFFVPCIILLIGFARMFKGMANNKPVSFLVFEIGVFSLISLMIAQQYSYTILVFTTAKKIWRQQNKDGRSNNILNNFSILGAVAVAGFAEYAVLANTFNFYLPRNTNSVNGNGGGVGGCGNGSSCSGGSGCGGGCGGCGGD